MSTISKLPIEPPACVHYDIAVYCEKNIPLEQRLGDYYPLAEAKNIIFRQVFLRLRARIAFTLIIRVGIRVDNSIAIR